MSDTTSFFSGVLELIFITCGQSPSIHPSSLAIDYPMSHLHVENPSTPDYFAPDQGTDMVTCRFYSGRLFRQESMLATDWTRSCRKNVSTISDHTEHPLALSTSLMLPTNL